MNMLSIRRSFISFYAYLTTIKKNKEMMKLISLSHHVSHTAVINKINKLKVSLLLFY